MNYQTYINIINSEYLAEVDYTYNPASQGAREAGTGALLEPNESHSVEVNSVRIYYSEGSNKESYAIDLPPAAIRELEIIILEECHE